jgi:hypothetical protein
MTSDPEDFLSKKMNTVKIKENEKENRIRSPFYYEVK